MAPMTTKLIDVTKFGEHFPVITEEGLEELKKRIGLKIIKTVWPWVTEAALDSIRHYAYGIGDDNPLWTDPDYAVRRDMVVLLHRQLSSTQRTELSADM